MAAHILHVGLPGCPWRLRENPIARDVLDLYSAREMTDPLALAGGAHAPNIVVEALLFFDRCLSAIHAHERECEKARRRLKGLPDV